MTFQGKDYTIEETTAASFDDGYYVLQGAASKSLHEAVKRGAIHG